MSENKRLSKNQIIKAIEELENNPDDKLGILADIGIGAVGAVGAGAAVAAFGGTSLLFGLITVAPPIGLIVGGAALGGAALVGLKRVLFDGTFTEGKRTELLRHLKEQLKDVETKERASNLGENDKTQFHIFLKEPIRLDLISPQDAQSLMQAVESGQMSLKEAYQLVEELINSANIETEDIEDINTQQLDQVDAENYYKQGIEKAKRGKYKEAIEDFTQAICLNRNYAVAYKYRGLAHSRLGENQAAIADFQKAADLYRKIGNTDDYQDVLDRALKLQSPHSKPQVQVSPIEEVIPGGIFDSFWKGFSEGMSSTTEKPAK